MLIECTAGRQVETSVAGDTYTFQRDKYGRFVCHVDKQRHIAILLSVVHYREVPEVPEPEKKAKPAKPAKDPAKGAGEPGLGQGGDEPDIIGINGIGPGLKAKLEAAGFGTMAAVAGLTEEQIAKLDADLKLMGRITRDKWVEQAQAFIAEAAANAPQS
ncbi:hypothetical protein [Allomesorhizobium alhagi]|uniref:50S ribosomal protein L21 n=1 Tax=Mesorhizobium alhagi CCNWXJ12-2 TaxID=1107882 RepID=H0HNI5_9HYPH|nr:hypothetical protein [Mesorhizobium alhagi]EHK57638.1 hypothetical protein MAXJ12_08539 [Mesorhizobium alhagi CCNWXJ12-2]